MDASSSAAAEKQEYVNTHIQPTLTAALAALCRERPADPMTFLAEKLRELESDCFAEMLPRVASSGGIMLIVRFEEPGGRYTAKTHVVQSRAARAPTDMPWWRAALLPAALERLNLEKRKANECLVKSELRSALRGYDSIIDTINVALSAPHVGPCADSATLIVSMIES